MAWKRSTCLALAMAVIAACSGEDGNDGPAGPAGPAGPPGPPGPGGGGADGGTVTVPGIPTAGLKIAIVSATAPAAGPPTVTFRVTDQAGTAVDFLAELAAGKFGLTRGPRFSIAQATTPGGTYEQNLYETATAGALPGKQTRPAQVPASIALADAAALYQRNTDGSYTFTFPTAAPALPALAPEYPIVATQNAQTVIGMQAQRTFGIVNYPAGASFEFIPAGGTVVKREVVSDAACNACHKNLTAHGSRRTVGLCITCHTPGWSQVATDNNTQNAIDMRVMIHQIHRGIQPTDVQNAGPWVYKWSATNDFSTTEFAPPNTVRNCVACHQGAQADNWKTKPSRAACGSCHYGANFETGVGHTGGEQVNDNSCLTCHPSDVDGVVKSTTKVHSFLFEALTNTLFQGRDLAITINSVDVVNPAAATVTFTVKRDGAAADIKAAGSEVSSLRFTVAGPTSDYGGPGGPVAGAGVLNHTVGYVQTAAFGGAAGAALLTATATPGQFTAPLPNLTTAMGQSVGIGVEAYDLETGTCPLPPCAVKEWAQKAVVPVLYAKVGGGTATPRRAITDAAKCNVCHEDLGFHGGEARKGPDYCAMCHNSRNVNDERTTQFEAPFSKTPSTVQLSVMIHKIHKGDELVTAGSLPNPRPPFILGATRDFRADPVSGRLEGEAPEVEFDHPFPGDIKDCQTCHLPGGYGLPEPTVLPTRVVTFTCTEQAGTDLNAVCGTISASGGVVAPDTAAGDAFWTKTETFVPSGRAHCTSCHDSAAAAVHIDLNTLVDINTQAKTESCDVCHGDGRFMDPIEIHVPRP